MYDYLEQVTADVRDYVEQEIDFPFFLLLLVDITLPPFAPDGAI